MPIHANSITAYHAERDRLSARAALVLAWVRSHGPCTDRQVMAGMGFSEPNSVRPRITELVEMGLLREIGSVRCATTGKTVRRVDVPQAQRTLFE